MPRPRLTYANVAATLALCLALAAGGPALAEPVAGAAASLTQSVKKALKLGRTANSRAKRAIRTARRAASTAASAQARANDTYTKAQSDARFAGGGAVYTRGEADALAGRAGNETFVGGEVGFSGSTFVTRGSATLTAPRAGLAVVTASASIHPLLDGSVTRDCALQMRLTDGTTSTGGKVETMRTGDRITYVNISETHAFAIPAGTSTFEAQMRVNPSVSDSCTATFATGTPSMTVVWVPFDSTGR